MNEWSPGIQKVLDHVAATEGWVLQQWYGNPALRRNGCCPAESAADMPCGKWGHALRRLGLGMNEGAELIDAADGKGIYPQTLRTALLKAARLA